MLNDGKVFLKTAYQSKEMALSVYNATRRTFVDKALETGEMRNGTEFSDVPFRRSSGKITEIQVIDLISH